MIFHLISTLEWSRAAELHVIAPESLATEGFAHCSTAEQIDGVIARYYADRDDMLRLTIDESLLGESALVWEAPAHPDGTPNTEAEESERYPHVYGPIPVDAVVEVTHLTA
ncbi:MAG: DUF952 domain-containing protein [Acidimicrobiales bacterium]